jgi:hypothetical protein
MEVRENPADNPLFCFKPVFQNEDCHFSLTKMTSEGNTGRNTFLSVRDFV